MPTPTIAAALIVKLSYDVIGISGIIANVGKVAKMCELIREHQPGARSFFVLDENFLLHRKRALRLLELMEAHGKSWALSVFSSARVLNSYTMDQLAGLGVGFVWMGLEGEESAYDKLKGVDTLNLVRQLQVNGIRVLGSSILGLEDHRPADMEAIIEYAVRHETVFHQFMLYTPIPGTPLHEQHQRAGDLLPEAEFSFADAHGQYRFNYRHRHFQNGEEEHYLLDAFRRDFEVNGPSILRLIRVFLNGWQNHKVHPRRVRERFAWEAEPLRSTYAGAVWAIREYYRHDPRQRETADRLLADIYTAFGWKTHLIAPLIGRYVLNRLRKEEKMLAAGSTYEPSSFCEKNAAELALEKTAATEFKDDLHLPAVREPAWR